MTTTQQQKRITVYKTAIHYQHTFIRSFSLALSREVGSIIDRSSVSPANVENYFKACTCRLNHREGAWSMLCKGSMLTRNGRTTEGSNQLERTSPSTHWHSKATVPHWVRSEQLKHHGSVHHHVNSERYTTQFHPSTVLVSRDLCTAQIIHLPCQCSL